MKKLVGKENRGKIDQRALFANIWMQVKRWFVTDTKTKVIVFIITFIVWLYTLMSNEYSYSISSRIEIRNIENGKTLKSKIPERIYANFTGRGIDLIYLNMIRKSSFKFVVDVGNIRQQYDFPLSEYFYENPDKIIMPRGARLQFNHIVYPETLHVELDMLSQAKVPIIPRLEIEESMGYIKTGIPVVTPDSIWISGPKQYVDRCSTLTTKTISLKDVSTPFDKDVRIDLSKMPGVRVPFKTVHVYQKVEQIGEKKIDEIPVVVLNVPENMNVEVSPTTVSMTVQAGISALKTIKLEDIRVTIDFQKQWKVNQKLYIPETTLPENIIAVEEMIPAEIELRIFRERKP
jgi:YbbR domain-containing protein